MLGSYETPIVVSPDMQKEKVTVEAAHKIMELKGGSRCNHMALNLCKIVGVIGKQEQGVFPSFPIYTLTPFKTFCRHGILSR